MRVRLRALRISACERMHRSSWRGAADACAVQLISAMAALAEFDAEVEKLFVYANRTLL